MTVYSSYSLQWNVQHSFLGSQWPIIIPSSGLFTTFHHCQFTIVTSPLSIHHCHFTTVSSPLSLRHCQFIIAISPLQAHQSIHHCQFTWKIILARCCIIFMTCMCLVDVLRVRKCGKQWGTGCVVICLVDVLQALGCSTQ